ncbi:MAG: hypothetical protein ABI629_13345 [bacterium]
MLSDVARREDDCVKTTAGSFRRTSTALSTPASRSVLDRAVIENHEMHREFPVDEVPVDYSRRLMSILVETPAGVHRLFYKGAPEEVFKR